MDVPRRRAAYAHEEVVELVLLARRPRRVASLGNRVLGRRRVASDVPALRVVDSGRLRERFLRDLPVGELLFVRAAKADRQNRRSDVVNLDDRHAAISLVTDRGRRVRVLCAHHDDVLALLHRETHPARDRVRLAHLPLDSLERAQPARLVRHVQVRPDVVRTPARTKERARVTHEIGRVFLPDTEREDRSVEHLVAELDRDAHPSLVILGQLVLGHPNLAYADLVTIRRAEFVLVAPHLSDAFRQRLNHLRVPARLRILASKLQQVLLVADRLVPHPSALVQRNRQRILSEPLARQPLEHRTLAHARLRAFVRARDRLPLHDRNAVGETEVRVELTRSLAEIDVPGPPIQSHLHRQRVRFFLRPTPRVHDPARRLGELRLLQRDVLKGVVLWIEVLVRFATLIRARVDLAHVPLHLSGNVFRLGFRLTETGIEFLPQVRSGYGESHISTDAAGSRLWSEAGRSSTPCRSDSARASSSGERSERWAASQNQKRRAACHRECSFSGEWFS